MMTLDYVGDEEAMANAQVGHHPLARATETSPKRSSGTLSCLSARPPDLANLTAAQPGMACVRPSIVPFLYSKRAAATRSPRSRYGQSIVLSPLRSYQPWNHPLRGGGRERCTACSFSLDDVALRVEVEYSQVRNLTPTVSLNHVIRARMGHPDRGPSRR